MIEFSAVRKVFSSKARGLVAALDGVDIHVERGRFTCIVGPSGCGKTTLLRLAAGLERPNAGRIYIDDSEVVRPPPDIALVSQEGGLLPWRSVRANIALGLELLGRPRRERRQRVLQAMAQVHLPPTLASAQPHELSGGMRQRVALARAWVTEPHLLLMDEPFSKLDDPTRHALHEQLLELWHDRTPTVLFVTHSIEEAIYLADRVVIMTDGRAVEEVAVDLPRPRNRLASDFVDYLLHLRSTLTAHHDGADDPFEA